MTRSAGPLSVPFATRTPRVETSASAFPARIVPLADYGAAVPLFRRRRGSAQRTRRAQHSEGLRHLEQWAAGRRGVEAFVEPQTAVTDTTVLLVAATGE